MKRLFAAASALVLLTAAPALAQVQNVTGTVTVTGSVGTKCVVVTGGTPGGTSFSDTIPLGALDDSTTGLLKAGLQNSTAGSPAGTSTFQISCNGSDATVTLSANQLATGSGTPPTGYARQINYSTDLVAALTPSGTKTFTYTTALTPPTATSGTLGGRLANAAGNIVVKVYDLNSEGGNTNLLEAGSYTSTISITIAPIT